MSFDDGILYEHNIEAYIKLMEAIEKKGKACAIHTTGSGKMYLALKWLVDHREESFTYVAPTNVILDKFLDIVVETLFPDKVEEINKYKTIEKRADKVSKLLGNNVNLLTYSVLMEKTKNGKKHLKSKRIVLDEFHHVGGEEWGKAVEAFLEDNQEAEIMGLSATPVRNDGKDMVEELFDGEIDSEITLEDALSRGILPVPNFMGALYSFEEELDRYGNRLNGRRMSKETYEKAVGYIKEAKRIIEEGKGIEEIFEAALTKVEDSNNAKFIVFCRDIEDKEKKMIECKRWFGTRRISIRSVDYLDGKSTNLETIKSFEEDKDEGIKLLFAVDMLNEGLHVEDIDGVIMMRPTDSGIIFLQQLGRALAAGHKKKNRPLILDLVNNLDNLESSIEGARIIERFGGNVFGEEESSIDFSIQMRMRDILEFLRNLSYTFEERIAPLKAYCEEKGTIADIKNIETYIYNGKMVKIGSLISTLREQYKLRELSEEEIKIKTRARPLTDEQVEILEKMGMVWDKYDFEERIAPLKAYYKEKGTIGNIVKEESYICDGKLIKIGSLIGNLRSQYHLREASEEEIKKARIRPLTDQEVEILEKMGMVWNKEISFEERIAPLKAYYEEKGTIADIALKETYIYNGENVKIGNLVGGLRKQYKLRELNEEEIKIKTGAKPLTDEQVEILEKMGMVWNKEISFEERIAPLRAYCKEKGTIADIEVRELYFYNGNNVNIGTLISNLRGQYKLRELNEEEIKIKTGAKPLTDEQVEILEKMGMVWNKEISFSERIAPLKAYYKEKGTLSSIKAEGMFYTYNGMVVNVGSLISVLRKQYKAREANSNKKKNSRCIPLTDQEVEILEKMGMVWDKHDFEERIAPLVAYYEEKGTIANIKDKERYSYNGKEINVGGMINTLRLQYKIMTDTTNTRRKEKPLTDEQVEILEKMGMVWSKKKKANR